MSLGVSKNALVLKLKSLQELVMDEYARKLLGLDEYSRELARILRELLAAGAKRDYARMIELARDIEQLVMTSRDGSPDENDE